MSWPGFIKSDYSRLLPILAVAFFLNFIPHHGYPYLVHVDEWSHLIECKEWMGHEGTTIARVIESGGGPILGQHYEVGFHVFWSVFHQVTGISWLAIFKYFPSVIFLFTALSVYIVGRRGGYGWEAALFACLIPTTVRILGPGFLVPIALGMLFIPLSLFVVFNLRGIPSYFVLAVFYSLLLFTHPITAGGLLICLLLYILFSLRRSPWHSLGVAAAIAFCFVALYPWIDRYILPYVAKFLAGQHTLPPELYYLPHVFDIYGHLPTLFFVAGVFLLARRGRAQDLSLVAGSLAFLIIIGLFVRLHLGVAQMYDRGFMYLMLLMSIIAGCALNRMRRLNLPERIARFKPALARGNVLGISLSIILVGLTLASSINAHLDTPYYHMIDEEDYEAFVWIGENVDASCRCAIVDPWKGTAFVAIAEREVYSKIHAGPTRRDMRAYQFLRGGCSDTVFLKSNGISIVYTRHGCSNPDLVKVRENVYLLKKCE